MFIKSEKPGFCPGKAPLATSAQELATQRFLPEKKHGFWSQNWFAVLLVMLLSLVSACQATPAKVEEPTLRMGLLPITDVLPMHVAQQEGYFAAEGITVELVPVASAAERDQLWSVGQIDGAINDLVSTVLFNKERPKIKVVRKARQAYPDAPQFWILAASGSPIQTIQDLRGVEIGVSENSVIEYVTTRLLELEGLSRDDVKLINVAKIPVRFELLSKGQLQAAMLPDPLASLAMLQGARDVVDDGKHPQISQSVLSFRVETLKEKPNTVRKFLAAWDRAVKELNEEPEKYRNLLIEKGRVPDPLKDKYEMPPLPVGEMPTEAQFQDVMNWLKDKGLITRDVPYGDLVDLTFAPK